MTTTDSYLRDVELDMEGNLGRRHRAAGLLSETKFKSRTKLSVESFELLCSIIDERLQDNEPMEADHGGDLSSASCVYLTLRWLTSQVGGEDSCLDLLLLFGVSIDTFQRIVWTTIDAIVESTSPHLDNVKFPQTPSELDEAARGFHAVSKGRAVSNCVSVLDGHLLRMFRVNKANPNANMIDVGGEEMRFDMMLYYSGHYEHRDGLNLQAAVDSKGRFQFIGAAVGPGVLSDNAAIRESGLLDMINRLPTPYVAMAGANYTAKDALAALYSSTDVATDPTHQQFNDCAQPLVDRVGFAIGGMAKMWNILQKPLEGVSDDQAKKLVVATARLYNFNLNQGVNSTKATLVKARQEFFVATPSSSAVDDAAGASSTSRREHMVEAMSSKKGGRPSKKARVVLGEANARV